MKRMKKASRARRSHLFADHQPDLQELAKFGRIKRRAKLSQVSVILCEQLAVNSEPLSHSARSQWLYMVYRGRALFSTAYKTHCWFPRIGLGHAG